jgi:hypothetical protein
MMGVAWTIEKVRGMTNERGQGFINFLDETPVLKFLATISIMNTMLRISLASLPVNKACSGNCGNIESVLLFRSSGCVSSSSLDSICSRASFFGVSEPELGPTPASFPFFFNSSTGKM